MRLKDYLKFKKISNIEFAKNLGISHISLSRYISGERFPEKKNLLKIYKTTDGLVTPNDFYLSEVIYPEKLIKDKNWLNEFKRKIRSGSRKHLAKSITLVESSLKSDQVLSEALLESFKKKKGSIRIGITGVPGVGKSTFIESFGMNLIDKGLKIAVLAIDPSSKKTGGSILGDKTRMEKLSVNSNAFIRPSPSDGHLGGVAKKTYESILCLEEAGFDIIFVETMGVGQAETEVYDMVDIFAVLLLPSGGDELQGIKKGIIEIADIIIVNKADGELKKSAEITQREYKNATHMTNTSRIKTTLEVFTCSSLNSEGFFEIWNYILKFIEIRKSNEDFFINRDAQRSKWMWNTVNLKVQEFIQNNLKNKEFVNYIQDGMKDNKLGIYKASKIICDYLLKNK